MLPRISNARRHLTFANAMSVIAVFIALGGASYAAVNLPKNSVGTKQLKGKSVGTKQLKGNAVNSNKVKDSSLRASDFRKGEIPSGPTGRKGDTGAQGPKGEPGQDATSLFAYVRDNGAVNAASVDYGNGVTDVFDPAGSGGTYVVSFDRDLSGCVVHATSGVGTPASGDASSINNSTPYVNLDPDGKVQVRLYNASNTTVDTSFLISAFC